MDATFPRPTERGGEATSLKTTILLLLGLGAPIGIGALSLAQGAGGIESISGASGTAGWAGAGLLSLVLGWLLLKHLPDKDKQASESRAQLLEALAAKDRLLEAKDKVVLAVVEAKDKAVDRVVMEFRSESNLNREASLTALKTFDKVVHDDREANRKNYDVLASAFNGLGSKLGHPFGRPSQGKPEETA